MSGQETIKTVVQEEFTMQKLMPLTRRRLIVAGGVAAVAAALPATAAYAVADPSVVADLPEAKVAPLNRMFSEIVAMQKSAMERARANLKGSLKHEKARLRLARQDEKEITERTLQLIEYMVENYPDLSDEPEASALEQSQIARIFHDNTDVSFRTTFSDENTEMTQSVIPVAVVRSLFCDHGIRLCTGPKEKRFDAFSRRYQDSILGC